MRDGIPLPGDTPAVVVSQLAHRVFGPLRPDRTRAMLDYHGLAGVPAQNQTTVAARHGVTTRTLATWCRRLTAAGSRLPISAELATQVGRRSRPGEDHVSRTRIAQTLGLVSPRPAISPSPLAAPSRTDRAAAAIAVRVLATAGPLPIEMLLAAVSRARRFRPHQEMTTAQLAAALTAAGATTDQGRWRAPHNAQAPERDRALVFIAAGRDLTRQEMIDALIAAGYADTSARARKISTHPLISHVGPDRYQILRELRS